MSQSTKTTVGIDVSDRHSYLCLVDTISGSAFGRRHSGEVSDQP
jgi:hypothetical protein